MCLQDLPITTVDFPCILTICASAGICMKFPQLSMCPRNIPVNFLCIHLNYRQFPIRMCGLPSTSVTFPSICGTFRQLLSTFCASERSSINFSEHSVRLKDLPSISVKFCESAGHFIYFHQYFVSPLDLPSTFRASAGTSVNFPCDHGTFCQSLCRTFSQLLTIST